MVKVLRLFLLLLSICFSALWFRSYWRVNHLRYLKPEQWQNCGGQVTFDSKWGFVRVSCVSWQLEPSSARIPWNGENRSATRGWSHMSVPNTWSASRMAKWTPGRFFGLLNFSYVRSRDESDAIGRDPSTRMDVQAKRVRRHWSLAVPYWFLVAISGSIPGIGLYSAVRRLKRGYAGCCRQCGYDLRASGGVCPECGTKAVKDG